MVYVHVYKPDSFDIVTIYIYNIIYNYTYHSESMLCVIYKDYVMACVQCILSDNTKGQYIKNTK